MKIITRRFLELETKDYPLTVQLLENIFSQLLNTNQKIEIVWDAGPEYKQFIISRFEIKENIVTIMLSYQTTNYKDED